MAAFVGKEPRNRAEFDAHWAKILSAPENVNRTIVVDGKVAGHIAFFPSYGRMETTYWLGREFWGRGVATQALHQMLALVATRPLYASAAADNIGSVRVLQKCGYRVIGTNKGFAPGRGEEIEETVLRLDADAAK